VCESDRETAATRRAVAVIVHHGDPRRTIQAVLNHWELAVFSDIIVIANDLRQRPESLRDVPCTWLVPNRNIGFGGACQLGAMTRQADIYAFFNAHITIDRSSVDRCIAAFDIENIGIAAPYVYHPASGKPVVDLNYARCTRTYSRILRRPIQILSRDGYPSSKASPTELLDNDWATGAAIFCRREVAREIGWDGRYFLGFEDVDISMRAKNSGWRVVVVPSAIAFHTGESTRTLTRAAYYAARNQLWFARKYRGRKIQILLTAYLLLLLCRIGVADALKRRRPAHIKPATRGLLDGWLLWPNSTEALIGEPIWSSKTRSKGKGSDRA